jgi:copper(I)-binding protein
MTTQPKVQCRIANRTEAMELSGKTPDLRRHATVVVCRGTAARIAHRASRVLAAVAIALGTSLAAAHGYQAGDVHVRHPFATPTPPGARIGAAYFRALENRGTQPDRLLRASTPAAARVELHSGEIGADGVMRMREKESIDVPPNATVMLRPGGGDHLMLMALKKPLVTGDKFLMTLEFERGGKVEVEVVVQVPKDGVGGHRTGHGPHGAGSHGAGAHGTDRGAGGRGH